MQSFLINTNKAILYMISRIVNIYILIGIIATALTALIIILYKIMLPDDFHEFMANQFINIMKDDPVSHGLKPEDITNGDILFLVLLVMIVMLFVWPLALADLILDNKGD